MDEELRIEKVDRMFIARREFAKRDVPLVSCLSCQHVTFK